MGAFIIFFSISCPRSDQAAPFWRAAHAQSVAFLGGHAASHSNVGRCLTLNISHLGD